MMSHVDIFLLAAFIVRNFLWRERPLIFQLKNWFSYNFLQNPSNNINILLRCSLLFQLHHRSVFFAVCPGTLHEIDIYLDHIFIVVIWDS